MKSLAPVLLCLAAVVAFVAAGLVFAATAPAAPAPSAPTALFAAQ